MNRWALYSSANICFALIAIVGGVLSEGAGRVHPLYLVALFALCSSPVLAMRAWNDRFGLLALFSFAYFMFFGVLDFVMLLTGSGAPEVGDDAIISADEGVILIGGLVAFIGYYIACRLAQPSATSEIKAKDWSEHSLILGGALLWIVSTYVTWQLRVHVLVDTTASTTARGYSSMSPLQLNATLIANYMQPMGVMILAYAYCLYRRRYLLIALLAAIAVEMVFGLVTDSKGQVLIGVILVVLSKILVDGKLPKAWLGLVLAIIIVVFPILQANRIAMGLRGTGHEQAAEDIGTTLSRALSTSEELSAGRFHSESFIERTSMKAVVHMIVSRTGDTVPFQGGHTIEPLMSAFIPRIIWPDRPDVQTGQLVNKEFHVSEQADTNISPSHLGELYWNFGWGGVLVGMTLIGALLGVIAARCDLTRSITLTRVLVLILTIKLLILGFESVINIQYTMWMRTMLAVGFLHLVFARRLSAPGANNAVAVVPDGPGVPAAPATGPRYPNLLT